MPKNFYNEGFGWVCIACESDLEREVGRHPGPARSYAEGEAESRSPQLFNSALAKWADVAQSSLICPRCGMTEVIEVA